MTDPLDQTKAWVYLFDEPGTKAPELPDYVGYGGAVLVFIILIVLWYAFVKWNERTGKCSAI